MNGGTCVDGLYKYTCLCAHLYNGTNCQNDLSSFGCAVDPCLNGGTCVTITGVKNYRCYCYNSRFPISILSLVVSTHIQISIYTLATIGQPAKHHLIVPLLASR